MNRLGRFLLSRRWLALPPLVIGVVVVGMLAQSKKELDRVEAPEGPPACRVVTARLVDHRAEASGYGVAGPTRRWSAVSEVGGRIVETRPQLRSGAAVSAGETLLVIDQSDYALRLKQRQAELDQAKAQLQELRVSQAADEASLAIQRELERVRRSDVERLTPLRRDATVTEYEYETAKAVYLQQKQSVQTLINSLRGYDARIASAEATIALAEARASEAQRDVDRTRIVAPFDGLLASADLEPGQYVAAGQSLFEVIDTSSVEVEAQFSMDEISRVLWSAEIGSPMATYSDDGAPRAPPLPMIPAMAPAGDSRAAASALRQLGARVATQTSGSPREYPARPLRLSSTLDERTRTIGVVVGVQNRGDGAASSWVHRPHVRAGTFCEVILAAASPRPVILLPRSAVSNGSAMVIDDDDRVRRRAIDVGYVAGDLIAVAGGLVEGERVVLNPMTTTMDGQLVRPIEATAEPRATPTVADRRVAAPGVAKP